MSMSIWGSNVSALRNKLIFIALLAGAGLATYRFLLTPEARDSLGATARRVGTTLEQVKEIADERMGTYADEDVVQNRRDVEADWARIGY
jgi:hypothetical protein